MCIYMCVYFIPPDQTGMTSSIVLTTWRPPLKNKKDWKFLEKVHTFTNKKFCDN